nr:hypothetical protein [Tanacetum cinerariifolium]
MGRDTVQLETVVNIISQEYLLEFTSEYGIPKALHPELPRPEDRILDFPEGKARPRVDVIKQEAGEKYPAVLYQALGLSQKLEQPLFLGGREGAPNCRGLAHECSKRWDADREQIFRIGRENTGYPPHSHPKTARGATLLSGNKPHILPGGRGALKNLKYPLVDQLEGLKDAPMDVIMAALHLESDTGDDAPQWVRELRPSSSQLTIPVYPEVRDPMNPWACKEEMLLANAIAANVSHAEKKKKCRIVCRTHGVGSAHHARSDGVLVFAPTVVPQGLAILLADAATQTESDDATLNNL